MKNNLILWVVAFVIIIGGTAFAYNKLGKNYTPQAEAVVEQEPPSQPPSQPPAEEAKIPVPDFELLDYDGNKTMLSDFSGKVVVLNFWASWCPPCKAEMSEFNELHKELLASGNAVLLSINLTDGQRETKEDALKYLTKNEYEMDVYYDTNGDLSYMFGVESIPRTFVIDKNGDLSDYVMGQTTKKAVQDMITQASEVQ